MDEEAASQYVALWEHQPVPYRPSRSGLKLYGESLNKEEGSVLIYGGTPELADLATLKRAKRVVRIDLSGNILHSMEALAECKWQNTESIEGDWLMPRDDWEKSFDVAWCDGGTLFLQFPDQWAPFFKETYRRLKPGGCFVFKSQSHPPDAPTFESFLPLKISGFQSIEPSLDPASRSSRFWELVADVWQGCHLGGVRDDGSIRKDMVKAQMAMAKEVLLAAYPDRLDAHVIEAEMNIICNSDGTTGLEFLTPPELVKPLLIDAGFHIQALHYLDDSRPIKNYCWQYLATK